MNNYEIVYIIHPALQEGRLNDIKNKIHDKILSFKGKVLYNDNWGKKKLAYAIDKQKYGTYLFCQFLLEGTDVKEINIDCELNSNILRHLITRIESCDILEEKDKKESKKELLEKKKNDDNSSKEDVTEKKVTELATDKEDVLVEEDVVEEDVVEEDVVEEDIEEKSEEKVEEKNIEEKDNSADNSKEK